MLFIIFQTPLLPCKQCHKKFKFEKSLLSHIVEEHSEAPNCVKCSHCNVRCPDMVTLKEHTTKVHERSLYECPHCKKTFVRAYHVQRHMKQKGCNGNTVSTMSCEVSIYSLNDKMSININKITCNFHNSRFVTQFSREKTICWCISVAT